MVATRRWSEKMEVRSANRGRGDLDNRVRRLSDLGIRNRIYPDVVFAVPAECSHSNISFKLLTTYRFADPRARSVTAVTVPGALY